MKNTTKLIAGVSLAAASNAFAGVITFDDNALAPNSAFQPRANTSWASGGVTFDHSWNDTFNCCWGNFTYSNKTDTTTPGFTNPYSAITGSGANGSGNYGVSFGGGAYINFDQTVKLSSAFFTNTTYSYLSMRDGDFFATAFGADDYLRLNITGLNNGLETSTLTVSLGEGFDLLDIWKEVDLSDLGKVTSLSFSYSGTDKGAFGLNTPTYFAVDDVKFEAVSEPAMGLLLLSGSLSLLGLRGRKLNK